MAMTAEWRDMDAGQCTKEVDDCTAADGLELLGSRVSEVGRGKTLELRECRCAKGR
jgi:hypothetical protein